MSQNEISSDPLELAREQIDRVDAEMARLFVLRMQSVQKIAAYKKQRALPILDAAREEQVIKRNVALIEDEDLRPYYEEWLRQTIGLSRLYQEKSV